MTASLRYLPRIEPGSPLEDGRAGRGAIGAEVMFKTGATGSLYGEAGFDQKTSEPLWPFPNEAQIKADMAAYNGPGAVGARGFAAGNSLDGTPQTLTKYVWEYLGNRIPADIYAGAGTGAGGAGRERHGRRRRWWRGRRGRGRRWRHDLRPGRRDRHGCRRRALSRPWRRNDRRARRPRWRDGVTGAAGATTATGAAGATTVTAAAGATPVTGAAGATTVRARRARRW